MGQKVGFRLVFEFHSRDHFQLRGRCSAEKGLNSQHLKEELGFRHSGLVGFD